MCNFLSHLEFSGLWLSDGIRTEFDFQCAKSWKKSGQTASESAEIVGCAKLSGRNQSQNAWTLSKSCSCLSMMLWLQQDSQLMNLWHSFAVAIRLLLATDLNVDIPDDYNGSAMHIASRVGYPDVVHLLIDASACIEQPDQEWQVPLMTAASHGQGEMVHLLLQNKATVKRTDKNGRTALHIPSDNNHDNCVLQLLQFGSCKDECDNVGETAPALASRQGNDTIVTLLLNAKADVERYEVDGDTPLIVASPNGHLHTMRRLLDEGAAIDKHITFGWSALWTAAAVKQTDAVKMLLRRRASLDIQIPDQEFTHSAEVRRFINQVLCQDNKYKRKRTTSHETSEWVWKTQRASSHLCFPPNYRWLIGTQLWMDNSCVLQGCYNDLNRNKPHSPYSYVPELGLGSEQTWDGRQVGGDCNAEIAKSMHTTGRGREQLGLWSCWHSIDVSRISAKEALACNHAEETQHKIIFTFQGGFARWIEQYRAKVRLAECSSSCNRRLAAHRMDAKKQTFMQSSESADYFSNVLALIIFRDVLQRLTAERHLVNIRKQWANCFQCLTTDRLLKQIHLFHKDKLIFVELNSRRATKKQYVKMWLEIISSINRFSPFWYFNIGNLTAT